MLFANARSAVNKLDVIEVIMKQQRVKCLAIAETWFSESHSCDFTEISDYCCFRGDRSSKNGGGVAIWAHSSLWPRKLELSGIPEFIEAVSICIMSFVYVICVYIPPLRAVKRDCREAITHFLEDTVDRIMYSCPQCEIVICGDFNRFPVFDVISSCNLKSMFEGTTYHSSQLDYIFMSKALSKFYVVTAEAPVDNSKVPHKSLLATPRQNTQEARPSGSTLKTVYDTRESYVRNFVCSLQCVDWSMVYDDDKSLDARVEWFHDMLLSTFAEEIPSFEVPMFTHEKPWMTPLIKHLINQRWNAYRSRDFTVYHHLKEKIKTEIAKTKAAWIKRAHSKDVWKTVKVLSGKVVGDPISYLCSQFPNKTSAVQAINDKFCSYFQPSGDFKLLSKPDGKPLEVPVHFVYEQLRKLSTRKSSPDLPCKLYKAAAHVIADPLTALFNESLKCADVPQIWKRATITAVPKCSSPGLDDLRPISLLPIPVKVLERFVLESIKPVLLRSYGQNQFGFKPRSSTTSALITMQDFITSSLDRPDVIGVQMVAYDMSKAFDRLQHDVILSRLSASGLSSSYVSWMQSYLKDRTQIVKHGDARSTVAAVTSGVPQGSIVGPFLFSMVVGSFPVKFDNATVIKYADDFTVCAALVRGGANTELIDIHERLLKWSQENCLVVNQSKCKALCIRFRKDCTPVILTHVKFVKELKILGVIFNENLTWTSHCNFVVKRASQRLYILRILKSVVPRDTLICVFNATVRSCLEYASPLFVGLSIEHSRRLESIQKRFHRLLCGRECREPCLEPLEGRRHAAALKVFKQAMNSSDVLFPLLPRRSSSGRFLLNPATKTLRLKSFFPLMVNYFNSVHTR